MSRYLCISVTFLDPVYHGRREQGRRGEWPPSPMRLFQALLAGSRIGCRQRQWSDNKAEAFRWLECRKPPLVIAPEAKPGQMHRLFVPNNDADTLARDWAAGRPPSKDASSLRTQKDMRPHLLLHDQTAHYLWEIDRQEELPHRTLDILCKAPRNLLALGMGIDLVAGTGRIMDDEQISRLQGVRWSPWDQQGYAGARLRVPVSGSLKALEEAHHAFLQRLQRTHKKKPSLQPGQRMTAYREVTYLVEGTRPSRPHVAFQLIDRQGSFRTFAPEKIADLAMTLRDTAVHTAQQDQRSDSWIESFLMGKGNHQEHARFSYLPLPTIGHPHADGLIRRVLVSEPEQADGEETSWLRFRWHLQPLLTADGQEMALLHESESHDRVLERYLQESKVWQSVTPVVLPGHDDRNPSKALRLLLKAFRQAGYAPESIEDLWMQREPLWAGARHAHAYQVPSYMRSFPRYHVRVIFRHPTTGPLAIGSGRHCGLGLFAASF